MKQNRNAIDHKKFEAIKRLKQLIYDLERNVLEVDNIVYLQTFDHKNGVMIITEYADPKNSITHEA